MSSQPRFATTSVTLYVHEIGKIQGLSPPQVDWPIAFLFTTHSLTSESVFRHENCKRAMELAQRHFNIPLVLEPDALASPHLDELSGMTYLSYFMKEEDSPGYYATLDWVKKQIPHQRINNFRVSEGWSLNNMLLL